MSGPQASDPALLDAFRKQVERVLASGDAAAALGLWEAWRGQVGVSQDDLVDIIKEMTGGPA